MRLSVPGRGEGSFRSRRALACAALISILLPAAAGARRTQPKPDLEFLLERAADYCGKLSGSVLDFVCRERVAEWFYPEAGPGSFFGRRRRAIFLGPRAARTRVYDYQLLRGRNGAIREKRTLLKENRKDVRVPDAPLGTAYFWHAYIVMGPLGLLSREGQAGHDYRIVREERISGEPAFVLEAVPKPGVPAKHLYGTVWLRMKDANILKIEWNPSSIANYAGIEETAERFKMTPQIVMTSEYAFEKNGIRFPSRYTVKEIYLRGGGRFQRSQTDVVYDQYKFFTVETQVVF